jgi:excisionase family DNA binding protein
VERLLTAEEAAKLLNVKVNTLAQWRANRARLRPLPYIRSGLKVCYRESDIAKYLETCVIVPGLLKKKLPRNRKTGPSDRVRGCSSAQD